MSRKQHIAAAVFFVVVTVAVCLSSTATGLGEHQDVRDTGRGVALSPSMHATRDAAELIGRVQDALGGRARLNAVRSLSIDARRIGASGQEDPYEYKVLFPDRYQEVRRNLTFTVDGAAFWQIPARSEKVAAAAHKNTLSWFGELCLVLLVRAPDQVPMDAEVSACDTQGRRCLAFTGADGFNRTLEIDGITFRPAAFIHKANATQGGAEMTVTRRVTIDEVRRVEGIQFPARMTETWAGNTTTIEYRTIKVNSGVGTADFERRQ